jgi:hypothetical protein
MKKINLILLFALHLFYCRAQQNLVYNPSFEKIDTCFMNGQPFLTFSKYGWYTYSSADLYTPCIGDSLGIIDTFSGVPINHLGFQYPVSGENYAGSETWNLNDFRDYLTGTVVSNLKQGKTYCGTFFVSPADTIATFCNDFGMAFTNTLPNGSFGQLLNQITPQIANNPSTNPLTDKINWTQVKGSFIAVGMEQYVTLGNFKSKANSDTVKIIFNTLNQYSSYYYLDDVSLIELKALHSNDTLVCPQPNFNQTLKAYPGFDSYLWSTGDTTRIINITQAGQYWVTASNWCGTVTDTIQVFVFNPFGLDQLLGADKTLCDYQFPQRLRPLPQYENTFSNFQWSTGSDTSFTDVLLPGTYFVTAEHFCGVVTDTITLTLAPNPILNLGNDTTLCIGQQITLNAGIHSSYTWSNQSITPSITINETGNYSVTVSNALNCIANDNIQVNFVQETAQLLPNDTALYANAFPYMISLSNIYSNYQSAQLPIVNNQLSVETEGVYSLTATDVNGCLVIDSINISLKTFELIVPSIISKNQNFIINNLPANSSLKVFDALGQIVYQSNNYQNNFMPLMANAVYLVELDYVVDGKNEKYIGKLLVVE